MTRVLIVGVGSIGERQLRCFRNTARADVSFCELNAQRREQVRERYELESAFEDLDSALRETWDAAVICTPAHLHVGQAIQVAESGAHLLIEKPLSTSLDDIERLRETIARRRRIAGVAYVLRTHPLVDSLRRSLDSGRFGSPLQITVTSGQHFPTYRPAYREVYYTRRETGGGAIQDAMTHLLNLGEFLAGPIDRVLADSAHLALPGVSVEDTVHVLTRQGTVLGSYTINQYQAPNESTLTLVCERGTARIDFHDGRWRSMVEPGNAWRDELNGSLERDPLFELQANVFLDAVEGKRSLPCSLEDGIQTLRVNLAVLASSDTPAWRLIRG